MVSASSLLWSKTLTADFWKVSLNIIINLKSYYIFAIRLRCFEIVDGKGAQKKLEPKRIEC